MICCARARCVPFSQVFTDLSMAKSLYGIQETNYRLILFSFVGLYCMVFDIKTKSAPRINFPCFQGRGEREPTKDVTHIGVLVQIACVDLINRASGLN